MNKSYIKLFPAALLVALLVFCGSASAQKNQKAQKSPLSIEVVDQTGHTVMGASVASSINRYTYTTDAAGKIEGKFAPADILKVSAPGYESKVIGIVELNAYNPVVQIQRVPDYTDEKSVIYTVTGDKMSERRTVGAYSKVDGKDMETNPTMFIKNALGGRLNGLYTMDNTMVPGFTTSTDFVRAPFGNYTVMVDGVERSIEFLEPEVIESVQLLKDASLKSLYGGMQSNGILMITTKRGKAYENSVRVNVQSGIQQPTRLPKYLNSHDYTEKYNEALVNSGFSPIYNPDDYVNGDPYLYPDVDYYKQFLNQNLNITRANGQFTGGSENTQYFVHFGYQTNGGLEKYTEYPNNDEVMTLRGNVDNKIFDFITIKAGMSAVLEDKKYPWGLSKQDFVLGGTAENQKNPYGYLTKRGSVDREYSYAQTDFSFDFDLNKWIKGLKIRPGVTFDVYTFTSTNMQGSFVSYELVPGTDPLQYYSWGQDTKDTAKNRGTNASQRNWAFSTVANYDRTFGCHDISALVTYYQQERTFDTQLQTLNRLNIGGMVNYMYNKRYIAEVSVNHVGVGSFSPSKRWGTFPTVGLGWIASEEGFLKGSSWLDYLKIRGSYGILGSTTYTADGLFAAYLFRDEWTPGGDFGGVSGFNTRAPQTQTGNPDVGFQKSYELNAGLDFMMFKRSLSGSFGMFHTKLDGALANLTDIVPGVSGKNAALLMRNYKQHMSYGMEGELNYHKTFSNGLYMSVGANATYGISKTTKEAEPVYPAGFEGLRKVKYTGDVKGYKVIGTFADAADIASSPSQSFGTVLPGDLKYFDRNGDNTIDERDQEVIANTLPSVQYGITLSLAYKGFNLDVLGYGLAGFERMLTSKYYQIHDKRKYSAVVVDGLPNGKPHPILRAESSNNNFVNSDQWVVDGSFFKLRNVELGYTLPHKTLSGIGINKVKVFARGFNLLTISKIKDLDPESLDAGVGNFPLCTTITGGVSISF